MLAKAKYRKDYKQPDFTVTDIFLDFQLDPNHTVVTAKNNLPTFKRRSNTPTIRWSWFPICFYQI